MKSTIIIVLGILIAVLLVGGAVAYTFADELGVNMNDFNSIFNKVKDKANGASSDGPSIVSDVVKENGQEGSGSYREVSYSDGGFRQYDSESGDLIGSSYKEDQGQLNKGDFD